MLNKEIVRNKCILAKLNLNGYAILDEVSLVIAEDWFLPFGFYLLLLLLGGMISVCLISFSLPVTQ